MDWGLELTAVIELGWGYRTGLEFRTDPRLGVFELDWVIEQNWRTGLGSENWTGELDRIPNN
jgi:hypothetical protein